MARKKEEEEMRYNHTILIFKPVMQRIRLPPQTKRTIPIAQIISRLLVPHGLGQGKPLRFLGRGVHELGLGRDQGGHAPESLVVVPERRGPVIVDEIPIRTGLV